VLLHCHCEPEGRGNLVFGLLRHLAPRNDTLLNVFILVIHENMNFAEYQMSHKGAAGKALSAPMPIYIAFFGLIFYSGAEK
jgi:hypothetical protein